MIDSKTLPSYFLGTNSPKGFYSYFHSLYDTTAIKRLYILKGGPGTGKSTLMKAFVKTFTEKNCDTELIYCSSDPQSLDGVIVKDLGIAIVDGTAPHVLEPIFPGAVHSIINLGDFINEEEISLVALQIMQTNARLQEHFDQCYRYLNAARSLAENNLAIIGDDVQTDRLHALAQRIGKKEFKQKQQTAGIVCKRFLTAISPLGIYSNLSWLKEQNYSIYDLKDNYGIASILLECLAKEATTQGYDVYACYHPFFPDEQLLQLIIPSLSLAFITTSNKRPYDNMITRLINLDRYIDETALEGKKNLYRFHKKAFFSFVDEAVSSLKNAKKEHDVLEGYYIPYVNFQQVDSFRDAFLEKLIHNSIEAN